jgi:hypothetical protein
VNLECATFNQVAALKRAKGRAREATELCKSTNIDQPMPGLVPGIQPTAGGGASGWMDSGDKRRNDIVRSVRVATL